jgi:hypothetical protein
MAKMKNASHPSRFTWVVSLRTREQEMGESQAGGCCIRGVRGMHGRIDRRRWNKKDWASPSAVALVEKTAKRPGSNGLTFERD